MTNVIVTFFGEKKVVRVPLRYYTSIPAVKLYYTFPLKYFYHAVIANDFRSNDGNNDVRYSIQSPFFFWWNYRNKAKKDNFCAMM